MRKTPKNYPMDGPPEFIQRFRSFVNRTKSQTIAIRAWVKEYKKRPGARPDTVKAYTV
jgi:hypothetical protein